MDWVIVKRDGYQVFLPNSGIYGNKGTSVWVLDVFRLVWEIYLVDLRLSDFSSYMTETEKQIYTRYTKFIYLHTWYSIKFSTVRIKRNALKFVC